MILHLETHFQVRIECYHMRHEYLVRRNLSPVPKNIWQFNIQITFIMCISIFDEDIKNKNLCHHAATWTCIGAGRLLWKQHSKR